MQRNIIQQIPKADLHRHFDGCIRPETIIELAKQQNIELIKMCEHEVSIKNRRTQSYRCLICGCIMDEKQAQSILVDISNDYQVEYIIEKELQNIIHSNKDLMQTMLSLIENIQYERDIKVYRR